MKTWLSFVFLLCCLCLSAQEATFNNQNGNYLTFGVGIPIHTVRDQAHSTLVYRGSGLRFFTTYEEVRDAGIFRLSFTIDNANLNAKVRPRQDVRRSADLTNGEFHIAYYSRLGNDNQADNRQYIGGAYSIQINNRSYPLPTNNTQGILFQSSLSVGALDRRNIDDNLRWMTTTRVDLPIFTALYRPTYIGIPPFLHVQDVKAKDFFSNFELVTINRFFKITAGIDADYQSKPWRTDRIAYDWSLLHTPLPKTKPMTATAGSLAYGFRVLL